MDLNELIRTLDIKVGSQLQTELCELWKGVLEKYSYVNTPDSNEGFKEMESKIPFVDDKGWMVLCTKVKALSGVEVEISDDYISVSRQDSETDGFTFELNHAEPNDEIDFSELYGKSRYEAIDYLQNSECFDYDYLYISAGGWILDIDPDSETFDRMLQEVIVALKQEDDLILKAIDDSERAIKARKVADKEKKYGHDKIYRQLLEGVRAELEKLGWEGDFRVFTSGNYKILWGLGLRITPASECYFCSSDPEDVLANVRDLYNFTMIQLRQQANSKFVFRHNPYLRDEKWEH